MTLDIKANGEKLNEMYSANLDKLMDENPTSQQLSTFIMIIGKSGRGKSTALRTLPAERTFIINIMGKSLPFPGGINYTQKSNMAITTSTAQILSIMREVNKNDKFNFLVIDDAQYIMAQEFVDKALVKGYDKFSTMAKNMWSILTACSKLRGTLKVFLLSHEEDTGTERKMKTIGKMLDEKLTPEGLATIVLFADMSIDQDKRTYWFETQSNGLHNAKSPMDMFPFRIPNDAKLIADRIDEYYKGVSLRQSKLNYNL